MHISTLVVCLCHGGAPAVGMRPKTAVHVLSPRGPPGQTSRRRGRQQPAHGAPQRRRASRKCLQVSYLSDDGRGGGGGEGAGPQCATQLFSPAAAARRARYRPLGASLQQKNGMWRAKNSCVHAQHRHAHVCRSALNIDADNVCATYKTEKPRFEGKSVARCAPLYSQFQDR